VWTGFILLKTVITRPCEHSKKPTVCVKCRKIVELAKLPKKDCCMEVVWAVLKFGPRSCSDMQVLVANIWGGWDRKDNIKNVPSDLILECFTPIYGLVCSPLEVKSESSQQILTFLLLHGWNWLFLLDQLW